MTIKRLSLSIIAFGALASLADAALVNIATNTLAAGSRLVSTTTGALLPAGNMVRIGTFPTGVPVITPTTTMADINAAFVPIGENAASAADGTNGPGVSGAPGQVPGGWAFTINNVDNTDARFQPTTRLFVMVLDVAPANMLNATGMLLMSDETLWTIPGSGARTMTTTSLQIDSAADVQYGVYNATAGAPLQMGLINTIIPEPASGAMALLAGLCFVRRRR